MKNKLVELIIILTMISCQVVDGPSPDESFVKFYGGFTDYTATDIEIVYDQSGENIENFIVFGTKLTERGDTDFILFRIDPSGNLIDSISFGYSDTLDIDEDGNADHWKGDIFADTTYAQESAGQVYVISDVGYAIVGTSSISESALDISDWKFLTFGFFDLELNPMLVNDDTLIAVGSENSKSVEGVFMDKTGNDIIQLTDGSFLITGGEASENLSDGIDFDNYIMKYSKENGVVFNRYQGIKNIGGNDDPARIFEKSNGNLVVVGSSNVPSQRGENLGNNGLNVFYWESNPEGIPINYVAYGLDHPNEEDEVVYNEKVSDVIQTSSGYTVAGTSVTSEDKSYGFLMNLSQNGAFLYGYVHDSSVFDNTENTGVGVVQAKNGDYILMGKYPSFSFEGDSRREEGMFVRMDQTIRPVEGSEINFGLPNGNDEIVGAVRLGDGKIVTVSNMDFGGGIRLITIIKLNHDGSF